MYTVYILYNELSGKIYIGQTKNLAKRIEWHNNQNVDKKAFTSINKGKWILVYREEFQTRSEALKREKQLKSSRGRDFIHKNILGR